MTSSHVKKLENEQKTVPSLDDWKSLIKTLIKQSIESTTERGPATWNTSDIPGVAHIPGIRDIPMGYTTITFKYDEATLANDAQFNESVDALAAVCAEAVEKGQNDLGDIFKEDPLRTKYRLHRGSAITRADIVSNPGEPEDLKYSATRSASKKFDQAMNAVLKQFSQGQGRV